MLFFFMDFYLNPKLSYAEVYSYAFSTTLLMYGLSGLLRSYLLDLVVYLAKKAMESNKYMAVLPKETINEVDMDSSFDHLRSNQLNGPISPQNWKQAIIRFLQALSALASWYALLCISVVPAILSGFDVIPTWASCLITLMIFSIKYVSMCISYCPKFLNETKDHSSTSFSKTFLKTFLKKALVTTRLYKKTFGCFAAFGVIYSVTVPLMTMGACLSAYNYQGELFQGHYQLSTRFSRHFELDDVCPDGTMCQLYATLPEDGATSVIINVHTGTDIGALIIAYDTLTVAQTKPATEILSNKVTAWSSHADLEPRGDRNVHSIYLSNLQADTMYKLQIIYNDQIKNTTTYRTLPDETLSRNVLIISGGDVGTDVPAAEMTSMLSAYDVDVIIVAGDLAYDNGFRGCFYCLDLFLRLFEPIYKAQGRLVPFIISLGNHDVGFNAYSTASFDQTQSLYYLYFPRHSKVDSQGNLLYKIPEIEERLGYSYHKVGNTVHIALDSAYTMYYEGVQAQFINTISQRYPLLVKMANFHVPMYPACIDSAEDPRTITDAREHWGTLFQQYKFASVFENHAHLYKKTYPLYDSEPATVGQVGVTYFGDGNWGMPAYYCDFNGNNTGILEAYGRSRHVWIIEATTTTLTIYAVNETNQVFDQSYTMTVADYI